MKKYIKWIALCFILVYGLLQIIPFGKREINSPFKIENGERPLVIAHGGAKLMNPENTWMAFKYAYDLGVDVLEMDLRLTQDNQLITYHNDNLEDFSTLSGKPIDYTYDEISMHNFGVNFTDLNGNQPYKNLSEEEFASFQNDLAPATLKDLFETYGDSTLYICEIKDEGERGMRAAEALLDLIQEYNLENEVIVASFNQDVLSYFRSIAPKTILTSFDMSSATDFVIANYAGYGIFTNYDHSGLQLPPSQSNIPLDTSYLIYKIHKNNMFVHYWTINDVDKMKQLIKQGADGLITDRPDLLIDLLSEMGYPKK